MFSMTLWDIYLAIICKFYNTNCCAAIKCDFETLDRIKGDSGKDWNNIFSGAFSRNKCVL